MIFKIQKPIMSTEGQPYLIYNKDRSIMTQSLEVGVIPELDALFGKEELKIFIKGYIDRKGRIVFNKKVPEQNW